MTRHILVNALIDMIPAGTVWPIDEQLKWFKAAKEAFALVYNSAPAATPSATQLVLPPPRRRRRHVDETAELTTAQRSTLDALAKMRPQRDAWIETSIRQIAQASGNSMGSVPYILEVLERKRHIQVEHNGNAGLNRYRVVEP